MAPRPRISPTIANGVPIDFALKWSILLGKLEGAGRKEQWHELFSVRFKRKPFIMKELSEPLMVRYHINKFLVIINL